MLDDEGGGYVVILSVFHLSFFYSLAFSYRLEMNLLATALVSYAS